MKNFLSCAVTAGVLVAALGACGDDSGSGGGDTTSGPTTTGPTTGATTSGMTTTNATGATNASATSSTTNATAATSTGGGSMACGDTCPAIVALAAMLPNCPYTEQECLTECNDALMNNIPMDCHDEFFAFVDCAIAEGPDSFSCGNGGPSYEGSGCTAEEQTFGACVGG